MRAVLGRKSPPARSRRAGDCAPCLIALLLLLAWQDVRAQIAPADDFFNSGAQFYISNNVSSALARTEDGLKLYPNNEKLKKLEELLKQQQQQQQQNQQNQQNQSQQQQQQQKNQQQNQSKQDQQQSQQQQKQDQQNQSGQKNTEQQKQDQQPQKSSADKQNGQKDENQNEPGQPLTAGQMTPEEAKRLLDAQKGDEQVLQWKPQDKPQDQNRPVKDW